MSKPQIILIVNSSARERAFLTDALHRAASFQTLGASSWEEGLSLALQHHPDLVVADYSLPPHDGLALFSALRQAGCYSPMILTTAQGSEALAVECLRAGISDYLNQPIEGEEFLTAVKRALSKAKPRHPALDLSDFLENAQEAVIAVDTQGRLAFCNAVARQLFSIEDAAATARPRAEVAIRNTQLLELLTGETSSCRGARREIVLHNGALTLHAQLTAIENVGCLVVMQNITHLKELDRIKSEFVHRVSRDIRSPLTTILGYAELMARMGPVNERQRQFIDRIIFSVQSITALLADLLDLSQLEAGFAADLEPTQLALIVRYAVDGIRPLIEAKNLSLAVSLPDHLPHMLGHPIRLRQMVHHLLDNAVKFTPAEGMLHISLDKQGDFLVLRVSDSGIGIPAEDQPHVFERFYRARNVVGDYEGAGLGLSLVKSIVDGHNGRVWVESQSGVGTTVTIMFPACRGHPESSR